MGRGKASGHPGPSQGRGPAPGLHSAEPDPRPRGGGRPASVQVDTGRAGIEVPPKATSQGSGTCWAAPGVALQEPSAVRQSKDSELPSGDRV